MNAKPAPQIISREAAYRQGLTRYYLGTPCRGGHIAERYVSNGACVDCLGRRFKRRQNAFSHDLMPYVPTKLWLPRSYTPEDIAALEAYMQRCIYEHVKHSGKLTADLDEAFVLQMERGQ